MAWGFNKAVVIDSQAAIGCILQLQNQPAESWIEREVIKSQAGQGQYLWSKHSKRY